MILVLQRLARLESVISGHGPMLTAFSGGVDSTLVAVVSNRVHGNRALAVTGVSASLSGSERDLARDLAHELGLRHRCVDTHELDKIEYRRNLGDRCYHCKHELFALLRVVADQERLASVACGDNLDDLDDHRPGMQAASEHRLRSPLLECGIDKATVRALAAEWNLPLWDKPATPCLSSRVAYGQSVTPERLQMIDAVEQWLRRDCNFRIVRVRYHEGDLEGARVASRSRNTPVHSIRRVGFRLVAPVVSAS